MRKNQEDYLIAVWEINETFGSVNGKEVSQRLKISPPTAWEELHRLADQNLLHVDKNGVKFTKVGLEVTKRILRNHRIAESFVYKMLEVPWEDTHEEVMDFEHSLRSDLMEKLWKNLGNPDRCPHGNPIDTNFSPKETTLSEVTQGNFVIKRITYEDHDLLRSLAKEIIIPGSLVKINKYEEVWELEGQNGRIKIEPVWSKSIRLM